MRTALATLQQLASEAEALPAAVPERADIEVRTASRLVQLQRQSTTSRLQSLSHAVQGVYMHASDLAVLSSSRAPSAPFSALSLIMNTV